ncbi:probable serine/threonine-protein kinase WNK11 [Chenopodium quinoa]|uniref:probable serine/threonine-protein kinase WNK11 n=1 Tax=Chenopodium quinoa TaxID=63459 RepID=UPI000B78BB78|nr:probable serine/threonine-protein kinase WNK11 [Chenopodium quinoa]
MADSSSQADELKVVERNPTRQFARYDDIITVQPVLRLKKPSVGNQFIREPSSESKVVYKGFDGVTGRDIAWSKTVLTTENHEILYEEAKLLHKLDHENIMKCYDCWVDFKNEFVTLNMITEIYCGNLRDYSKKHWIGRFEDTTPIKNWCRHVLGVLIYLHGLSPPIYLRSLCLENFFVIGNSGVVKLGDLCSAIVLDSGSSTESSNADADAVAVAVANARSEIYEFGMCVLQMVYKEAVERRWRDSRDKLQRVMDQELKEIIQKCIGGVDVRPTAIELLNDPFLELSVEDQDPSTYLTGCSLPNLRLTSIVEFPPPGLSDQRLRSVLQSSGREVEKVINDDKGNKKFGLKGRVKDRELIQMDFVDYGSKRVRFHFSLETNTVLQVVEKFKEEYGLSDEDTASISQIMEQLITELVPEYANSDSKKAAVSENAPNLVNISTKETSGGGRRTRKTARIQHRQGAKQKQRQKWIRRSN